MPIEKRTPGPRPADAPKPKTTTDRIIKLVDRWEECARAYSLAQVAETVGCSRQLVENALKRWRPELLKGAA